MKKIVITLLSLFCYISYSQEVTNKATKTNQIIGNNEIKLNGFYLALGIGEVNYERILNDESAVGLAINFNLDNNDIYNFAAIPYYRFYFGEKRAAGFFIEANTAIISDEVFSCNNCLISDGRFENKIHFGVGIAAGGKFLSKKGWVGEVFLGIGRIFRGNNIYVNSGYPRVGISIGKRF